MMRWLKRWLDEPRDPPRPILVIKTIEGRRSDRRPVLPQEVYERQREIIRKRLGEGRV